MWGQVLSLAGGKKAHALNWTLTGEEHAVLPDVVFARLGALSLLPSNSDTIFRVWSHAF